MIMSVLNERFNVQKKRIIIRITECRFRLLGLKVFTIFFYRNKPSSLLPSLMQLRILSILSILLLLFFLLLHENRIPAIGEFEFHCWCVGFELWRTESIVPSQNININKQKTFEFIIPKYRRRNSSICNCSPDVCFSLFCCLSFIGTLSIILRRKGEKIN